LHSIPELADLFQPDVEIPPVDQLPDVLDDRRLIVVHAHPADHLVHRGAAALRHLPGDPLLLRLEQRLVLLATALPAGIGPRLALRRADQDVHPGEAARVQVADVLAGVLDVGEVR